MLVRTFRLIDYFDVKKLRNIERILCIFYCINGIQCPVYMTLYTTLLMYLNHLKGNCTCTVFYVKNFVCFKTCTRRAPFSVLIVSFVAYVWIGFKKIAVAAFFCLFTHFLKDNAMHCGHTL